MISYWAAGLFCFSVFFLSLNLAGYAFAPDKIPLNIAELLGWAFFICAIISWEIARK